MKKIFYITLFTLPLIVIFQLHQSNKSIEKKLIENQEKQATFEDDFNKFNSQYLAEYINLKAKEKKFNQADELFGKTLLLFLAHLGFKLEEKQKRTLNEMAYAESIGVAPELEVTIDPYKDLKPNCPDCPICPKISNTSNQKENSQEKASLNNAFANMKKQIIRNMRRGIDGDIYRDYWKNKRISLNTRPIFLSHFNGYEGQYKGDFFRHNQKSSISISIDHTKESKDEKVTILFNIQSNEKKNYFYLDTFLKAEHPVSHGQRQGGKCRGLVLKSQKHIIVFNKINKFSSGNYQFAGRIYEVKRSQENKIQKLDHYGDFFLLSRKDLTNSTMAANKGEHLKSSI